MTEVQPRAQQLGWVLLPLRAFLAVVFLDGGISKIADRRFLDGSSPSSMHATVLAVKSASPIGGLLAPVAAHSFAFGLLMAVAEIAVGLGMVLGLWTRIAAVGGMVLALSLWLTISWNASPWFTSADLVYLFAFTPLLVAGAGAPYSLDAWLESAARRHPGPGEDRTRRSVVTAGAAVGALVVLAGASLGRRSPAGTSTAQGSTVPATGAGPSGTGTSSGGSSAAPGAELVKAAEVPVGGAKQVTDPTSGDPTWVLQLESGRFTALDAVCPHQGCPVSFVSAASGFQCPCHESKFTASGARVSGPAPRGLSEVAVVLDNGVVRRA